MEGDAAQGLGVWPRIVDQKDEEGHSVQYQDQGLALNRQNLKNSIENATHLQQDLAQGLLWYLRYQPRHPPHLLISIPGSAQRFPIQCPQGPIDRIPTDRLLPGHELSLYAPFGDTWWWSSLLHHRQYYPQVQTDMYALCHLDDNLRNPGFVNRQN